ncbi:PAS domain S-box protein [Massilia psychrophila]|uniref:histidine kinase n=1 Tax=Massilia psychrophila TaxID=1603353 RepID=A0A2G8T370_9BURK|nr:PAS domain S-box protein [Massilia psychrophila]PIL40496.1 PAS domain-containing sensor histidine kinase [Massilia psychrophila]
MKIPFMHVAPQPLGGPLRFVLPAVLVLLFLAVLLWLPWQAREMENNERQEQLIADTLWVEQAVRFALTRSEDALASLGAELEGNPLLAAPPAAKVQARFKQMLNNGHELRRVLWLGLDAKLLVAAGAEAPSTLPAASINALKLARATRKGRYSEPYQASAGGGALVDYYLPLFRAGEYAGSLAATYDLKTLLDETVPWWFAQDNAISLIDPDDKVLAKRAAAGPGRGVYTHKRPLDLPGATIVLATDSVKGLPRLLPNLLVGSVIALALGLLASLAALWRHIARRLEAEGALRQQMAFRTAMENSLVTGLRARDLEGRVTYVNPAFCQMVGLPPEELVGKAPPMAYWAPEAMADYQQRFASVLAGHATPQFETIFQRADGKRVPVLIFEAALVDSDGRQTGWMGSILDISERKNAEELARQQQEKLHASARLATMGEISSMLAHELNQPLAAISSYTTGALNLLGRAVDTGAPLDPAILKPALEQASVQARRAGQIIRSVHEFVKKREPERQEVHIASLVDGIGALIDMQASKYFVAIQTSMARALPAVSADRMMLEQVLLNLTRNAIEAMQDVAPERRVLRIAAAHEGGNVTVAVIDQGHGIAPEVAERLFSPFFSTKAEGMGVGLSICRTAIEFHGGTLTHCANPGGGTIFKFALPSLA